IALGDRTARPPGHDTLELGADGTPTITTAFYGLQAGELALLIPGISSMELAGDDLRPRDAVTLALLSEAIEHSFGPGSALAVLRAAGASDEAEAGWTSWGTPSPAPAPAESEKAE